MCTLFHYVQYFVFTPVYVPFQRWCCEIARSAGDCLDMDGVNLAESLLFRDFNDCTPVKNVRIPHINTRVCLFCFNYIF